MGGRFHQESVAVLFRNGWQVWARICIVKDWWKFAWILVARYDDGYVNAPGKMAQEVGYPKGWYDKSEWHNGPTTYQKQKNKPTE
jgi:hypothetical protein